MRSNAAESSVFLEVNGAIQFCYVCCAAIPWPFKITSKIWDCYAAIRFLIFGLPILDVCYFLDFQFWMCAIRTTTRHSRLQWPCSHEWYGLALDIHFCWCQMEVLWRSQIFKFSGCWFSLSWCVIHLLWS